MEFNGKKVKAIEVYDPDNDIVIAHICEDNVELYNGYKLKIIPVIKEECGN